MMIMVVVEEEENENDEFNVCLYEFEWDKYQWKTKSQVPEEQCRLEEKEVCFHRYPHDHQCHKSLPKCTSQPRHPPLTGLRARPRPEGVVRRPLLDLNLAQKCQNLDAT